MLSREELFNLYVIKGLSDREIAEIYGYDRTSILCARKKYGIPTRQNTGIKGRRSTREMTMYGNSTEEVKQQFEEIVTIWASMRMPSISHAQLVSVFPAKEG